MSKYYMTKPLLIMLVMITYKVDATLIFLGRLCLSHAARFFPHANLISPMGFSMTSAFCFATLTSDVYCFKAEAVSTGVQQRITTLCSGRGSVPLTILIGRNPVRGKAVPVEFLQAQLLSSAINAVALDLRGSCNKWLHLELQKI